MKNDIRMISLLHILAAVLLLGLLPSCAWWQKCNDPANAGDKACAAAKITVDCTKGTAISQAPNLIPLVKWILSGAPGGQMDWKSLLNSLMHAGFELVSCTANQLDNALAMKVAKIEKARAAPGAPAPSASDEAAYVAAKNASTTAHNNWTLFMSTNYPNVSFKMPAVNPLADKVE